MCQFIIQSDPFRSEFLHKDQQFSKVNSKSTNVLIYHFLSSVIGKYLKIQIIFRHFHQMNSLE